MLSPLNNTSMKITDLKSPGGNMIVLNWQHFDVLIKNVPTLIKKKDNQKDWKMFEKLKIS